MIIICTQALLTITVNPNLSYLCARDTMPYCPRCGVRFKTDCKVIRHLSQPRSSCVNLINDLISIPLQNTSTTEDFPPEEGLGYHVSDANMGDSESHAFGDANVQMAAGDSGSFNNATEHVYREEYANAAQAWGPGETYMGKFDSDDYADLRKENLYYPFASKEDWELAAFLLRSGLSMALIDDFLSLKLVSTWPCEVVHYFYVNV
jgi:hypothetical protein